MNYTLSLINNSAIQISEQAASAEGGLLGTIISALIGALPLFIYFMMISSMGRIGSSSSGLTMLNKFKLTNILKLLRAKTGRETFIINHGENKGSLFSSDDYIDDKTMRRTEQFFIKHRGKPIDIVLNTYGGSVFHAIKIAKLIHNHDKEVRVIVPYYAMSGGSLLAMSGNKVYLGSNACLGCIDVQISNFIFDSQSGRNWNEIVKKKGTKASDTAYGHARTARQVTKGMQELLTELLRNKINDGWTREAFVKFLTEGEVEHIRQLNPADLKEKGLPVKTLDFNGYDKLYYKLIDLCRGRTLIGGLKYDSN